MINKIFFGGLNYIHYKSADKQRVQADNIKLNNFIKTNKLEKIVFADICSDGKTIGFVTKVGNPDLDITLLSLISKDLVTEYMKQTRVDLSV